MPRRRKDELIKMISQRELWINELKEMLPYADHGAYGQDKKRIFELQREVTELKALLTSLERK